MSIPDVSEKNAKMLPIIKKNIESSHQYFYRNANRFHEFMKFVFETTVSDDDREKLQILLKPTLEFNVLEAMVSRLIGEFCANEPVIGAQAEDGIRIEDLTPEYLELLELICDHLRYIFRDSKNDSIGKKLIKDMLGGGYSAAHVYTDFINPMSFEQRIIYEKVFDPTLCGFDPLARDSHKGDGEYCFQLFPRTKEEFEEEYGKNSADQMKFFKTGKIGNFAWSYNSQKQDIILVADYFCKRRKKETIVKLSNGHVVVKRHYKKFIELWNSQRFIEQAPVIISERVTTIELIDRYQLCETKILKHDETFYDYLPIVFFDGNSTIIRDGQDGACYQMCKPITYNAKGIQQLKNFAGQTVGAEIENMVMHKFIASLESIPKGYEDAYKNVQIPSNIIYNAFYKDDPTMPLTPPREVQRTQTPPIVENVFMGTDKVTQTILGSYDSVLGTNEQDVSGRAIQQGAIQSSAASSPYMLGYIDGMNRVAQIVVSLFPKIYTTPRSIPVIRADGKKSHQIINKEGHEGSVPFNYDPNGLQVKIEAGVSTEVQKQIALDKIIQLTSSSPVFAEFMSTMGLETIVDNLDIRGIEKLKKMAAEFMQQKAEAAQAQEGQGDPMIDVAMAQVEVQKADVEGRHEVQMMELEQKEMKMESDHAIQAAKVAAEKQKTDIKYLEVMLKAKEMDAKLNLEQERIDSENARTAVESALNISKHHREGQKKTDGDENEKDKS